MGKAKKVGLGIGIAFAILIILGAVGSYTSTNSSQTPKVIPLGEEENPANMGDTIFVGDITYKVTNVSTTQTVGNEFFNEKAEGIFIVLNMDIENNGKESAQILNTYFKLVDSQGRVFEGDNEAWIYLKDNTFLKQLQPNLPTKGQAVFDVPRSPESYTLKISGGLNSLDKKYIYLGKYDGTQ